MLSGPIFLPSMLAGDGERFPRNRQPPTLRMTIEPPFEAISRSVLGQ